MPVISDPIRKGWDRFVFEISGFFACLFAGKVHRYRELVAQARYETGDYTNSGFILYKNGFSLHAGSWTLRRSGVVDYDGGNFAVYDSNYKCWLDRLEWDDKAGIVDTGDAEQYIRAVYSGGYLGRNPSQLAVNGAVKGTMHYYNKSTLFPIFVTGIAKPLHAISTSNWWWIIFLVSVTWFIYVIYKKLKKK